MPIPANKEIYYFFNVFMNVWNIEIEAFDLDEAWSKFIRYFESTNYEDKYGDTMPTNREFKVEWLKRNSWEVSLKFQD